jgi:hypothetical protein
MHALDFQGFYLEDEINEVQSHLKVPMRKICPKIRLNKGEDNVGF